MKIKNITLLFLLVSSFGNANEKNRESEGLMLHLYPKNICDDPFALEPDRISSPSEDPFADPNSKVEAADDPFADPKANAQGNEEDRRKRGLHLTQGAFLKRLRTLDPKQFSKTKAKEFAKLTQLCLVDLTLTDDDFLCLVKWMPALENLYLWSCNFPKSSLEHLTGLKDLTKLSLQFCGLGNESMGTLSKLKALTSLNLTGNSKGFTDEGLEGLTRLEHLEHLDLSASSLIKGPGLRHLVKLKHLSELYLGHPFDFDYNGIRDEGFDRLAKMTALKKLSLRYCTEFSPESLDKLTGLKNLEVIDFSDSFHFRDDKKGIRPALTRLQKALPDCKLLVSKRFEDEEDWLKRTDSKFEGYDPYDPFAFDSDLNREVDALLAWEPTAPPSEPKKLADASQNSSQEEKTFNARIGYLSIYASDKPIAFFDGHRDDLEYISKASVLHNFGSKEFDASGFVEFSDVQHFSILGKVEDSFDVGISVEVKTLEVDGDLSVSMSARFTEFDGFSEAFGQFTPKFVSREFLFKSDDIGTDERIFIYSDIIKEEHKTMFIVLKISEE